MQFPKTRREDVVDVLHGTPVADPYRWLEDATIPEVKDWVREQNDFLWKSLDKGMFDRVSDELVKTFHTTNYGVPVHRGELYFFTKRLPGQDQTVLYYKQGLDGEEMVLVDPNKKCSTVSLDFWTPSRNGAYVAYGLSSGGTEMSTIYIIDVKNDKHLSYEISHCRNSSIRWLGDTSFYYTRNPRPGEVSADEVHMHTKVFLHVLGDNPLQDKLIFGAGRPKDDMIGLSLSVDERFLAISATNNWTQNNIFIYDRDSDTLTPLVQNIPSRFTLYFSKDRAFLYTNYKANNFRLLVSDFSSFVRPIDEWAEAVPEHTGVLESISLTRSKMILHYIENVCSRVEVRDHSGVVLGNLPLPPYSTLEGVSTERSQEEFFYSVSSYLFPNIIYRYDPESNIYNVYVETENPINPNEYVVTREWCVSKDGTRIPVFIIRSTNAQKPSPTILYGYGGFNISQMPAFMRAWMVGWVAHGGTFAIANIRGGGEFGEAWHNGGTKEKKQNSFDDFIATGEYLVHEGFTTKEQLGILGGSNGGLLTAACSLQRPDLFGAVVSAVPLVDMVRFPTSSAVAIRWTHEYGNPDDPKDFDYIYKYSPYHNVKPGVEYPSSLYLVGENDSRVNPYHGRKMVAMLQSVNKENPILLYTESDAGHGVGKPIRKIIENTAIRITFLAQRLGLKL